MLWWYYKLYDIRELKTKEHYIISGIWFVIDIRLLRDVIGWLKVNGATFSIVTTILVKDIVKETSTAINYSAISPLLLLKISTILFL